MCGISAWFGRKGSQDQLSAMVTRQHHRGPDADGTYLSPSGLAGLGHNRLSIIDLSPTGSQPRRDPSGRYWIVFNGEIYNYLELRAELKDSYQFQSESDTEVLLAAYLKWGEQSLKRLIGMFAFIIWDEQAKTAFGARDRFGVKPLHYGETPDGTLCLASEIKALFAAGVPRTPHAGIWATYLTWGMYDYNDDTFYKGVRRIPAGGCFRWSEKEGLSIYNWYDLAEEALAAGPDERSETEVTAELNALLEESVRLRFRADVPVGICLSGGLDSSLLLGLVHKIQGMESSVKTFTFYCGDPAYDELPWVKQMLDETNHPACFCRLSVEEVPDLAVKAQLYQEEPFGGLPTLGMAKVHERALAEGVTVLLDGNGLDEGWAGYEYYQRAGSVNAAQAPVQGSKDASTRPECLMPDFANLAEKPKMTRTFSDPVLSLQYRDIRQAKIPRAMRFADRISMMSARELREPFLDHRIVELGLRQPVQHKIGNGQGKLLPRKVAASLVPRGVHEAPKRALQTPQREWLRGPLKDWSTGCIESALKGPAKDWFDAGRVREEWNRYCSGASDNSFYVWQWISAGLLL